MVRAGLRTIFILSLYIPSLHALDLLNISEPPSECAHKLMQLIPALHIVNWSQSQFLKRQRRYPNVTERFLSLYRESRFFLDTYASHFPGGVFFSAFLNAPEIAAAGTASTVHTPAQSRWSPRSQPRILEVDISHLQISKVAEMWKTAFLTELEGPELKTLLTQAEVDDLRLLAIQSKLDNVVLRISPAAASNRDTLWLELHHSPLHLRPTQEQNLQRSLFLRYPPDRPQRPKLTRSDVEIFNFEYLIIRLLDSNSLSPDDLAALLKHGISTEEFAQFAIPLRPLVELFEDAPIPNSEVYLVTREKNQLSDLECLGRPRTLLVKGLKGGYSVQVHAYSLDSYRRLELD